MHEHFFGPLNAVAEGIGGPRQPSWFAGRVVIHMGYYVRVSTRGTAKSGTPRQAVNYISDGHDARRDPSYSEAELRYVARMDPGWKADLEGGRVPLVGFGALSEQWIRTSSLRNSKRPASPLTASARRLATSRSTAASGISTRDPDWVFPAKDRWPLPKVWLRWALITVLKKVGIKRRVSTHGLRRTFNNLSRQVAGEIVTRSITGHVTSARTEHYSHVGSREKLAAAGNIVRMVMGTDAEKANGGSGGGSKASRPDDTLNPSLPN